MGHPYNHNPIVRRSFLLGMMLVYNLNRDDFRIADQMRDVWKQ
jgi:hypothetical protein